MSKRLVIISLILFVLIPGKAQEKLNLANVDKQSYALYLKKDWAELIKFSKEATKEGIDFYYLQLRTGIAYFELAEYRNASLFFLKAYSNTPSSEFLQEYLYYSLVYSGRTFEAEKYASHFTDVIKKKIDYKKRGFQRLSYEAGYSFNSDFEDLQSHSFSTEANLGEAYGEAYLLKNYNFHTVDLSHKLAKNLTLNHSFTYIDLNREALVDWGSQSIYPIQINQYQYFLNPTWVIGKKLNISPSMHLIFGNNDVYVGELNSQSEKVFKHSSDRFSDLVFSTTLWSTFGNFTPGLEVNVGNIKDNNFSQLSAWVNYYPFSNSSFYISPQIYFRSDENNSFGWNALGISAGARIRKFYLTGLYLFGDMESFVENGGYLVSNFPGKSNRKIVGSLYFPLGKKYQLVFRYLNQEITEEYRIYSAGILSNALEYSYTKSTLTGGISWTF